MLYEELLTQICNSGLAYRWFITVLVAFLSMKSSFDIFVLNLATVQVPYHCAEVIVEGAVLPWSGIVGNYSIATNFTIEEFTCKRPRFQQGSDGLLYPKEPENETKSEGYIKCASWIFKPDPPGRWTMFMEYEMVCDRKYLTDRMQTILQLGIGLSTLFGPSGDIIGRKPLLVAFCYLDLASNLVLIFVNDLSIQMVLRFLMGFGAPAVIVGLVLIMEIVGEDYRGIHGNLLWVLWVIAYCGSSVISYFVYNWRVQMVVVVCIIGAGYATYIPILPESPRWLLTRRKTKRAKRILQEMCKFSHCKDVLDEFDFDNNDLVKPPEDENRRETDEQSCLFNIIPRENICRTTYFITLGVITFCNFTAALVYYALSFKRDFITRDPYLNVLISGLLELPAYILAWQLTNRVGRKYTTLTGMIFCGLGLVSMPYVPTNPDIVFQASSLLAIATKFSITVAFSILGVFGSEVLPTRVRSCSFFFATFVMRSAQILAPELGTALAEFYAHLPYLLYGGLSVLAGVSILALPETKDKPMPNTVAEMKPVFGCRMCSSRPESSRNRKKHPHCIDVPMDEEATQERLPDLEGAGEEIVALRTSANIA